MYTSSRPLFIEQLRAEAGARPPLRPAKRSQFLALPPDPDAPRRLFTVCTGNRWLELGDREPEPKMLFGEFWQQGELCILFADTNAGKSVLAVQIGNSISRHRPIGPFALGARRANVLYVDFELETKQFCARYSSKMGGYNFSDRFIRAVFTPGAMEEDGLLSDEVIIAGIEQKLRQLRSTVLIIDNITCLRGGTENASVALSLMKRLKTLKTTYKLSILVLAHTPKCRNPSRPLSTDDLQGSKMLINFADSAFAIGRSGMQKGLRYLKQIKQRSAAQVYGDDNVCLCSIQKLRNFTRFRFYGNSNEQLHLCDHVTAEAAERRRQLASRAARLNAKGLSQRQTAEKLKISVGMVNKLLKG